MTTAQSEAGAAAARTVTDSLVASLTRGVVGSGKTACHCPFTGERLAELPEATEDEVAAAFDLARAAQPGWAARPARERAGIALRFHDLLLRRQTEVLDLIQLETGKSRLSAHEEVQSVAMAARYYGRTAPGLLRPRRHLGAIPLLTQVREARRPHGVVGQISPWNYPLELSAGDVLPALLAGNAVVHKPDTETALTALWARRLLIECGLPAEVWTVVLGAGPVVGPLVVEHADYVTFTGSTRTGRTVAQRAAARLVGSSLELGGKNALLVLRDADLDRAAEGAVRACFSSAGQLCVSIERLLVDASVADAFLARFLARVEALRIGPELDYGVDVGSLSSAAQLATVVQHVEDARARGATVLAGGRPRPDLGPYFHEPTVLTDVAPPMRVCAEETFGPVVSVRRFATEDEAVTLANDTRFGLNASVWSRDARRARRIAARLRCGTVNINEGYAAAYGSVRAPMGGMGDSGLGRRHGAEGLLKFTEPQTVARQRLLPLAPSHGLDDRRYTALISRSLRAMKSLGLR
ncbi:succinic semialdehyde dehydrogenase [Streptomyces sp. DSM 44915]|uniref:Succinic semialdehyde dehydrogenase n=1 Tax=Streptomyces chisholmiae TaxID=3075540 RepID=A0ABU2JSU0_9ACTN|nr:succinic semialdehyde dehydrogenase [Streptomyces sp. DSM 44915]MDT0267816.1 succinic semialdehyde dehydrogenase [Streptomyces sp. DSM 44915]